MNSVSASEYIELEERLDRRKKAIAFLNQQEFYFGLTAKARTEIRRHSYLNAREVFQAKKPSAAYKMIPKRYRDEFFAKGAILVRSVATYQRAELVDRSDNLEGNFVLLGEDKGRCISSVVSIGKHVLAYCMTVDKRVSFRDCDSGYQVADIPRFTQAVTDAVNRYFAPSGNRVVRVLSALCQYRHSRVIVGPLASSSCETPGRVDAATLDVVDDAKYFLKPADPCSREKEFRIIWVMENDVDGEGVVLTCPDAVSFCRDIKRFSA